MLKLLHAGFSRLWKAKLFWGGAALMALIGAAIPLKYSLDNRSGASAWTPDTACFIYAYLVPILLSVLTALVIGSEYSDGTMRNKCIVGHRRGSIYLANLIVCMTSGVLLCAAYLIPYLCLALPLLGSFTASVQTVLLFIALTLALSFAFVSCFALAAMLTQSKAHTAAACILLVFALLLAGIYITSALNEPEYYSAYSYTENGVTVEAPEERNPNYLTGAKRQVYEFLQDFTPGGQALQLAGLHAEKPAQLALYSGTILLLTTCCGILVFRRKDLK